ncbi:hypothetical protein H632_c450p0 [Helicosporidium sp. ATCC 50920]|nr:hypothetical protein H632_c450p0 [Helicosporidium sp. ATCC 50920]|eukprot:KDD75892.1 hypothetical protein H632_c450p0 [Helicosporidium sp. ATCC 50920]
MSARRGAPTLPARPNGSSRGSAPSTAPSPVSLSALLEHLAGQSALSAAGYQARHEVICSLNKRLLEEPGELGKYQVEPYGSLAMGVCFHSSDVDLCLVPLEGRHSGGQAAEAEHPGGKAAEAAAKRSSLTPAERARDVGLLRALANKIQRWRLGGSVERRLHDRIRVPIVCFSYSRRSLDCDVSCQRPDTTFKSLLLGVLAQVEPRLQQLIMLVKLWAKAQGVNDAAEGSYNSWCLSCLALHHCQTRPRPLLPPLSLLLGCPSDGPPHQALQRDPAALAGAASRALAWQRARAAAGQLGDETLASLFCTFLKRQSSIFAAWVCEQGGPPALKRTLLSVWHACFLPRHSAAAPMEYDFFVQDPYDLSDNSARSIRLGCGTRDQALFAFFQSRQLTEQLWAGRLDLSSWLCLVLGLDDAAMRQLEASFDRRARPGRRQAPIYVPERLRTRLGPSMRPAPHRHTDDALWEVAPAEGVRADGEGDLEAERLCAVARDLAVAQGAVDCAACPAVPDVLVSFPTPFDYGAAARAWASVSRTDAFPGYSCDALARRRRRVPETLAPPDSMRPPPPPSQPAQVPRPEKRPLANPPFQKPLKAPVFVRRQVGGPADASWRASDRGDRTSEGNGHGRVVTIVTGACSQGPRERRRAPRDAGEPHAKIQPAATNHGAGLAPTTAPKVLGGSRARYVAVPRSSIEEKRVKD